jgi:N-ethylmaleimide reductase
MRDVHSPPALRAFGRAPVPTDLFAPLRLGALEAPNRIVMAPMTRRRASRTGLPSPLAASYYAQRASAGLIITEATWIAPEGAGPPHTPGLYTDGQAAAWAGIADAVHRAGGRIALQLWHAGRLSHPRLHRHGCHPIAPSPISARGEILTLDGPRPFVMPRVIATDEVPALIATYVAAARRAIAAGCDAVEVHAAEGCLLDQFLRDATNRRTDRYGGSPAGRARLPLEVLEAVSAAIGADRVGLRVSPLCPRHDMGDSDPRAAYLHLAEAISGLGLAWLHVAEPVPPSLAGEARRLTREMRDAFGGPVILAGGHARETAEAALGAAQADAVAFGRPFIANPDLPRRLRDGLPLAEPEEDTILTGGAHGYIDYPALPDAPTGDHADLGA